MNIKNELLAFYFRRFFFCTVISIAYLTLQAQFYDSGQDPASIRWKQINTVNFQVIFPEGFDKEANRFVNTLEYLYHQESLSLNHKPRKISVLLHSHSAYSNGMVTWAPKRMEVYTTPAQDNYGQDWLDQLAVHELRHVVQIDKLNQGLTRIAGVLFGQQAIGTVIGLIPRWFLEGDAVNTETALTSTGRGRDASFEMEMKALVTSRNSLFSYEKALRGSYKDYVPDAYRLGYPMVAWGRKNWGPTVFEKAIDYTSRNPFLLYPFPLSLKKQTGLGYKGLYQSTYTSLKHQWNSQIMKSRDQHIKPWNVRAKSTYTNYRFPRFMNDSAVIAIKSGIDQLKEIIVLDKSGHEKKIHTLGNFYMDNFSYAQGKFTWAEEIPDIRWSNRSFYGIKIGNLRTNEVKLLTHKSRYFAPALSPDGKKIAAIEVSVKNECFLVVLDAETGDVLNRIPSPQHKFLQLPAWTADGNEIIIVATSKPGKSIEIVDVKTNNWRVLVSPTYRNITQPCDAGVYVLYASNDNGTDNLYAVNKLDTTVWQVTDMKYGAASPAFYANNNLLGFASYSSQGFDMVSFPFDPALWVKKDLAMDFSVKLYEASARQENFNVQDSVIPQKEYEVKSYSKLGHIINIHSWAPFYYDYNNLEVSNNAVAPGFSILSQDKLATCISSAGYAYDQGQSYVKAGVSYRGLFPVINFLYAYGGNELVSRTKDAPLPVYTNKALYVSSQVYVPLNLTHGCYITGITPSIGLQYQNQWFYNDQNSDYVQGMSYVSYGMYAYRYLQTSLRDLAPKWGASFIAKYTGTPFESTFLSAIWYVQTRLYLPGLVNHHSLRLTAGHQEQQPLRYLFSQTYLAFPRGYVTEKTYKLTAFSADYGFPVAYPDFALGAMLYVKRIRGNLFGDLALNRYKYLESPNTVRWATERLTSAGFDITADFHFLRIIFPLNAGVRTIYLPKTNNYTWQLLLTVDLTNY